MGEIGVVSPCERLPMPLGICPCCSGGIKFSRAWTWITPSKLFGRDVHPRCAMNCATPDPKPHSPIAGLPGAEHPHALCSVCTPPAGKHGLVWIGEQSYTPGEFAHEAVERGFSRRMPAIPLDVEFGITRIYFAHKKAVYVPADPLDAREAYMAPGVFYAGLARRVDLVVDTDDPEKLPEKAKRLKAKLGDAARLVKVVRLEQEEIREPAA
jgi:hypothetical protein